MSHTKRLAALCTLAGAGVALTMAMMSPASAQGAMQGWYKVCNKQQDIDVCSTMNNVVSSTGQPLTMINLIEVTGAQNQKRISIQVPTGRLIPEGIKIKIDEGKDKAVPYVICNGPACIANDALDNALIDAMKKGNVMTVTSVNFQGAPNPIQVSLTGFTQAFTGPGMQEQDFQAEQEKLQRAVIANQKAFEDRMRAEQEKAKAAAN